MLTADLGTLQSTTTLPEDDCIVVVVLKGVGEGSKYRFIYQQLLLGVEGRAELIGGEEEEEEAKEVMRKACTQLGIVDGGDGSPLIDGRHRAVLHKKQYH